MKYTRFFNDLRAADSALVGRKGTNLSRMARAGFPVPPGFCITVEAYHYLVEVTGLSPMIARMLAAVDFHDAASVNNKASRIRELISQQPIPQRIADEIEAACEQLAVIMERSPSQQPPVAVRSSAVAANLPGASFAGQHDSFLNIRDQASVLQHIRLCWASLWTARAITQRHQQGIDQQQVYPAVIVQAMVDPQTSGVVFTANPINRSRAKCLINASWGLGEASSSAGVSTDTYVVNKMNGRISKKHIACKERMITPAPEGGTVEAETADHLQYIPALSERQVAELTALASRIEDHFGEPQEIAWANDGCRWYILQSRPVTPLSEIEHPTAVPSKYIQPMFVEILPETASRIISA